jgi:hypothetical protein
LKLKKELLKQQWEVIHNKTKTNKPVIYSDYWLVTSYMVKVIGFSNVVQIMSTTCIAYISFSSILIIENGKLRSVPEL